MLNLLRFGVGVYLVDGFWVGVYLVYEIPNFGDLENSFK